MAGLYLHIPFCKQACNYCNFHFSTSLKYKQEMVQAIGQEILLRQDYLADKTLDSIYFGGGTPSLLDAEELDYLFGCIRSAFTLKEGIEITLEANPDDFSEAKLRVWQASPINRLSIGIQSFSDDDLRFMNRAHNASEATQCLTLARAYGFDNLTVDLIYGAPTTSDAVWQTNVQTLLDHQVPHISCYALTVEPRTALDHQIRKGLVPPVVEEQAARQFEQLMGWLTAAGYLHYEISNFARPGHLAQHNSSYWQSRHYLGVGPSAHSFNGHSRQWNVANNAFYLQALRARTAPDHDPAAANQALFEMEILSPADQYNEAVMTGLRTMWGVDPTRFPAPFQQHFLAHIPPLVADGLVELRHENYVLTPAGRLLADGIASDLFYGVEGADE